MPTVSPQEITQLLADWGKGDRSALEKLLPLVHAELRRIARRQISHERPGHTLQATALINEAYLKLLLLLFMVLRRERVAAIVLFVIIATTLSLAHERALGMPFAVVSAFLVIWVLYRYGLLALISALFVLHLVIFFPITSDFSAWYAADYVLALIVCLALVIFGFYTSLAGEPLFRGAFPDD